MTIESIKARLEAATEGPWEMTDHVERYHVPEAAPDAVYEYHWWSIDHNCVTVVEDMRGAEESEPDFDLIAHAPTDLRALLKVAEAAKRDCQRCADYSPNLAKGCAACCAMGAALAELEGMD
jgi:hypothetical protein